MRDPFGEMHQRAGGVAVDKLGRVERARLGFHQSTLTEPMSIGAKSGAVSADFIISSTAAKRPIASASLAT
jgi:hypothetical protein